MKKTSNEMELFPYFPKNENQCDMFLISLFVTRLHLATGYGSNITENSRTRTFYTGYRLQSTFKEYITIRKYFLKIQFTFVFFLNLISINFQDKAERSCRYL